MSAILTRPVGQTPSSSSVDSADLDPSGRHAEFCSRHGIRLAKGRANSWLVWSVESPDIPAVVLARLEVSAGEFVLVPMQGSFRWSRAGSLREVLQRVVRGRCTPDDR
jgi:hypothetical protein